MPAWAWPAAAVLVALVVRVVAWRAQPFITVDGTQYVSFAEAILAGRKFETIGAPGYPLLIAPALALLRDRVASAALISFLCGSLLPWPVWALARGRLGDARAVLPALAIAIHPELARYSAVVMSESAFLFALFGGLALTGVSAPGAGVLMGAAYVIRPEAILPAAALGVRGAWRLARGRTAPRVALLGLAGFLALALPCIAWYHANTGEWTLSPKLVNVGVVTTDWRTIEPSLAGAAAPPPRPPLARRIADAAHNVRLTAGPYAKWLLGLWPAPLLLLSLAGLRFGVGIEAAAFTQIAALAAYNSAVPRFLLVLLPALALLAALPAARLRGRLAIGAATVALAGAAWLWVRDAREFFTPFDGHIEAHVDAGRWLGAHSSPGEPVLDRKPYIAFYAEQPYVFIPEAPYDSLVDWAVRTHVRWLVVDQGEAEVFRQQLRPLLYDGAFRERERRLELVYVGGRVVGYGVGLFRVLQPGEPRSGLPPALEAKWLKPQ
jgi:hypothetical protein